MGLQFGSLTEAGRVSAGVFVKKPNRLLAGGRQEGSLPVWTRAHK